MFWCKCILASCNSRSALFVHFFCWENTDHISCTKWSSMTWCTDLPSRAKKPVEQSAIRSCDKIMPAATCSHFPLSLLCTKDMSAFEDRFEDKFWQSLDSAWVLGCMILYVLNTSEYVSNKRFDLPQVTNFSFSPRILTLVSWTMSKTQARLLLGVSATREWFEFRKGNHMTQVEKWVCARACMIHSLE